MANTIPSEPQNIPPKHYTHGEHIYASQNTKPSSSPTTSPSSSSLGQVGPTRRRVSASGDGSESLLPNFHSRRYSLGRSPKSASTSPHRSPTDTPTPNTTSLPSFSLSFANSQDSASSTTSLPVSQPPSPRSTSPGSILSLRSSEGRSPVSSTPPSPGSGLLRYDSDPSRTSKGSKPTTPTRYDKFFIFLTIRIPGPDSGLEGFVWYRKRKDWKYFHLILEDISQAAELKHPNYPEHGKCYPIIILNCKITTKASTNWIYFTLHDYVSSLHLSKLNISGLFQNIRVSRSIICRYVRLDYTNRKLPRFFGKQGMLFSTREAYFFKGEEVIVAMTPETGRFTELGPNVVPLIEFKRQTDVRFCISTIAYPKR